MDTEKAFAIDAGNGQFLSAFAINVSGKKGTSVTFHFCESVAGNAIIMDRLQVDLAIRYLRIITEGAEHFRAAPIMRGADGKWSLLIAPKS